jgi:hypothetical protein
MAIKVCQTALIRSFEFTDTVSVNANDPEKCPKTYTISPENFVDIIGETLSFEKSTPPSSFVDQIMTFKAALTEFPQIYLERNFKATI